MPLLYQQSKTHTTPARSNMGHAHTSSQEQSCQEGATYHNQHILVRK